MFLEFRHARLWFGRGAGELASYVEVFMNGDYEIGHPVVHPAETVIDIGANIGLFSISHALKDRDSQIYAFEPNPGPYGRLVKNIQANGVTNVTALNLAVYSSRGPLPFVTNGFTGLGRVAGSETNDGASRVEGITLGDFCSEAGIEAVGLVKIDVEGAEVEVLLGATETLGRIRQVVVECHSSRLLKKANSCWISCLDLSFRVSSRRSVAVGRCSIARC